MMLRHILAAIAGYGIFAVSALLLFQVSHHDPHRPATLLFGFLSTLYGMAFAWLGGSVASRIAGRRSATIVGGLIALGALVSLLSRPGAGAIWSQLAALFLMAPAAVLGGVLTPRHRTPQ